MGFIGVILSGLLLAIIATAFMVLLNSGIIHLVTLFLEFKNITYKKSFFFAFFVGIFNLALSLLVIPFKNFVLILQIIGLIAFVFINYFIASKIYEKESKKQRMLLVAVLLIFSIAINFLITFLITILFKSLRFGLV